MTLRHLALSAFALLAPLDSARTQTAADTLWLGPLQDSAIRRDPRGRGLDLLAAQSALRLRNIAAERLPTISLEGQAQYQSDVARIPITLPGGVRPPGPPHDTYDARIVAQQLIHDPGASARRAVEAAQLAASEARVRTTLFSLRQYVSDVFFAALRAQSQIAELQTTITDLEAQLRVASARVREGTALASEANAVRAELLRRRQSVTEWSANRRASLVVLSDLTGQAVDSTTFLGGPDLSGDVAQARDSLPTLRARVEYEEFSRSRDLLERQERARSAQDNPRVSAFGRVGYGQPGLDPLNDQFDSYWLAGVQLQWTPWRWGTTKREREVLALQRQMVSVEEAAFTESLRRGVAQDLEAIDRLERTVTDDETIVALRESIATETRARFAEGAVTSAEYVDRQTDVLSARTMRALHRVELAQARARFLTALGVEVR